MTWAPAPAQLAGVRRAVAATGRVASLSLATLVVLGVLGMHALTFVGAIPHHAATDHSVHEATDGSPRGAPVQNERSHDAWHDMALCIGIVSSAIALFALARSGRAPTRPTTNARRIGADQQQWAHRDPPRTFDFGSLAIVRC